MKKNSTGSTKEWINYRVRVKRCPETPSFSCHLVGRETGAGSSKLEDRDSAYRIHNYSCHKHLHLHICKLIYTMWR